MNKKISYTLFVLFLSSVLFISCNNNDKTGSETATGIAKYAGTWIVNITDPADSGMDGAKLIINNDGSITDNDGYKIPSSQITADSESSYTVYQEINDTDGTTAKATMNIKFTSTTSANIDITEVTTSPNASEESAIYKGTLTKQQS
ncbi:hypothetical protein A966_01938 [Brachyspira hampsonii 30446]|uniref:Lipocalin-like domain-containing protein n=1 Tax=Brachyspira hampsonii 30446 TaxID=1289135 RepID=A0A2U4FKV3_9SPIR|nr:hypothetical protein [Brachyspira hampsonii]EKV58041.1 hypothetical protein A966_01938 [Brachyspira hampsonii 30446]MBW5394767.1 hypothetical protein [Brachyspira hampsonii]OEJ16735.1 hypothetical protein A9495_08560 [Brachyspira hampsonii]